MIEILRNELIRAGIVVDAERRCAVTRAIVLRGWTEFERLRADVGLPMESVQRSVVTALGMGASITEFAITHIEIPRDLRAAVTALAGLTTVIVSAFDAILDGGGTPPQISLGETIQEVARHGNLKRRIFARLVELFYVRLEALPKDHIEVRSVIDRSIRRMYAAELQSSAGGSADRSVWWRKNVLPFLVMAAPAWLTVPQWNPGHFREQMRWQCRLGEFLGWVDDIVDLSRDVSLGHTNRVRQYLESGSEAELAGWVANQGRRILREWDSANRPSPVRDTFAVIVWSWMDSGVAHQVK